MSGTKTPAAHLLIKPHEFKAIIILPFKHEMHMIIHQTESINLNSGRKCTYWNIIHSLHKILRVTKHQILAQTVCTCMV